MDNAPSVMEFFRQGERLQRQLDENKACSEPCDLQFLARDHQQPLDLPEFDLLISQYAGNVGQVMKHHLRLGGILLVAGGNEDAELAAEDPDYTLLGTVRVLHRTEVVIGSGLQPVEYFFLPDAPLPFDIPIARHLCVQKSGDGRKGAGQE